MDKELEESSSAKLDRVGGIRRQKRDCIWLPHALEFEAGSLKTDWNINNQKYNEFPYIDATNCLPSVVRL